MQKDFYSAITIAQPQSAGYKSLQYQMYIVTGLHTGDCYVTPASEIRMMAVNMERQRWINGSQKESIQLNRQSGILTLYLYGNSYKFKIKGSILASLLLNRTVKRGSHQSYKLRKPLPVIVTYYTCEMQEGILLTYKDADGQDQHLEKALYALH